MAAINIDIGGNTSRLDRDIQKTVNKVYNINLKTKGEQPLGRITGKVNEFNKSLDASNARVIAFGASAGVIYGLQKAFTSLVSSTIEVQKSLQDINVILNVSTSQLNKFGSDLFSIARNTGQSFDEVAKAATEFSRQGLGVAETLKRTSDALILSRLSGLDTVKSVEALTAAVNSFASQAVTATEIVNKFANVDAAFAVSSSDLAEAISRVGSSAAQSGVSLNELIALVTSAQQTTARGGAVIGNSFKTIFTRLQRGKVVDLLGSLGISDTTSGGQVKSTIQLLQDLAKVYDTLGARQQAAVAEQVGGVFQINILKATLSDLSKEYSTYNNALNTAASSTDEAIRRNEELNKTYAAQINALQQNAKQAGSSIGGRLIGPTMDRVLGSANDLLGGVNESDGKGYGATLGKGILDGLGQILAGPGLILIGGVLMKLVKDFSKFAVDSGKGLLGLNTAASQQKALQESITAILQKNPKLFDLAAKGEQGVATAAERLLINLKSQTEQLILQEKISAQLAKQFYGAGVRVVGGTPVTPTPKSKGKAAGYIPNFVSDAIVEKYTAISLGATSTVRPHLSEGTIGGRKFVMNSQETEYPNVGKNGDSMVIPHYGDGVQMAARGFVPNFAAPVTVAAIAASNSRVRQKLDKSTKENGNLESNDQIQVTGIDSKYFNPNTNKNTRTAGISGKKYETAVLDDVLKGGGWKDNKGLSWGGSSAIDAYRINGQTIELAEMKGGRFLNQLVLNKFLRAIPENYNSNNELGNLFKENNPNKSIIDPINVKGILVQASKPNQTSITSEFSEKKVSKAKAAERNANAKFFKDRFTKNAATGFIPNFAKDESINLGDLSNNPLYQKQLVSAIIPQPTQQVVKIPAEASYLNNKYKGLIPVSGPNRDVVKKLSGQSVPNLNQALAREIVNQTNIFGRALGASQFITSASELPNLGGVNSAAGVAFEGGVQNAIGGIVQGPKNRSIDFTKLTPNIKKIFNNAPGVYEAKSRPSGDLINDVFRKFLNLVKPGGVKKVTSGPGFKDYQAKRQAAIDEYKKAVAIDKDKTGGLKKVVSLKTFLKEKGFARGFIPNFSALQDAVSREHGAGIPKSQIYIAQHPRLAATGYNPLGLGVFNKIDEPTSAARNSAVINRGYASGFVPNFALGEEDVQSADLGSSIGALVTQLGFGAYALQGFGESVKTAKEAYLTSLKSDIEAQQLKLVADREAGISTDKLSKTIAKNTDLLNAGGGFSAKINSIISASATSLTILAPILAETIKNAIGQETKTQRVTGSAVSAGGQALSMAGLAASFAPDKAKGRWAVLAFAATAALSSIDVFKQAATDLPELSRASKEASQKLSAFSNIAQQSLTTFEQIAELRNKGQSVEAGTLQTKLLTSIGAQTEDPTIRAKLQTAIINKDQESLRKAIEENTKKLQEANDTAAKKETVDAGIQRLNDLKPGITGDFSSLFKGQESRDAEAKTLAEKRKKTGSSIFAKSIAELSVTDEKTKKKRPAEAGRESLAQLKRLADLSQDVDGYAKALEELGYDQLEVDKLVKNEAQTRGLLVQLLNDQIDVQANIIRNTGQGSAVIAALSKSLETIKTNYVKYSSSIIESTKNQIAISAAIKDAKGRIKVADLTNTAELTSNFIGETSRASLQSSSIAGVAGIDQAFAQAVQAPITEAMQTLVEAIGLSNDTLFNKSATLGQPDENKSAEQVARENFAQLQQVLSQMQNSFDINNITDLLPAFNTDTGFNVKQIIESLQKSPQFSDGGNETDKKLETLETQLQTANKTLQEQRVIQTEQKVLLAQQKFTEIAKIFQNAAKTSFGGFEGFITNGLGDLTDKLNESIVSAKIMGNPQTLGGQAELGRNLGSIVVELSKIAGQNVGENLAGSPVIDQIVSAQATDIETTLNNVFDNLQNFQGSQDIADAFRKTLGSKFNLGDAASNKDIAGATAEAQTKAQFGIMPAIAQEIQNAAKAAGGLTPELENLLKDQGASAFVTTESNMVLGIKTSNTILSNILQELQSPGSTERKNDNNTSSGKNVIYLENGKPADFAPGAAGGFFPAFANTKEYIAKNFKQETQEQSKYGYGGGRPVMLSKNQFNPKSDAILNPLQMAAFGGGLKNVSRIAAGGYFPNFATVPNSAINDFLGSKAAGGTVSNSTINSALGKSIPSTTTVSQAAKAAGPKGVAALLQRFNVKSVGALVTKVGKSGAIQLLFAIPQFISRTQNGMGYLEAGGRALIEGASSLGGAFLGSLFGPFGTIGGGIGGAYIGSYLGDLTFGPEDRTPVPPTANPEFSEPPPQPLSRASEITKEALKKAQTFKQPQPYIPPNFKKAPNNMAKNKAQSERELQAQLMRYAMGASAEFKNYDKNYNETGISDMYSAAGSGSRIDLAKQIADLNKRSRAERNPAKARALVMQKNALKLRMQNGDVTRGSRLGQVGEQGFGAMTLAERALQAGKKVNGKNINTNNLSRVIVTPDGKVMYSRTMPTQPKYISKPVNEDLATEMGLGMPKSVNPANLGQLPNKRESMAREFGLGMPESVNPADLGKLQRTFEKEKREANVSSSDVYSLKLPELKEADNPEGRAVFNKKQEPTLEKARRAVEEKSGFVGGGGKFGGRGASGRWAGGYFPNFADTGSSGGNNISVSVGGINITANASTENIDVKALSDQVKQLLETEVPKLQALSASVSRMGQVVNLVQDKNPGKYNLPPKQIAK